MALNYTLGGKENPGKPKKIKYPGIVKRVFVNKNKEKFDSGEKKEFLDKKKKTYSVKTGKMVTTDGPPVKTKVQYEVSPAEKGKTEYVPKRAFTDAKYPETSSPEEQAKKAGKPTSAFGKKVEDGYQNAVKNKQETYEVQHENGKYKFKAGSMVTTPDKPAVMGEKTVITRPKVTSEEVLSAKKPEKFAYKSKKVENVKSMFGKKGYADQKKSKNVLNRDRGRQ
jgi:hypothetical protein